jgi:hypothetical protein
MQTKWIHKCVIDYIYYILYYILKCADLFCLFVSIVVILLK